MLLPQDIINIIQDMLHSDITEYYQLILRPCRALFVEILDDEWYIHCWR